MPWPFFTEEEYRHLEENQKPSDFITKTGVRVTTTHSPLFDRNKTILTFRTYQRAGSMAPVLLLHDLDQVGGEVFDSLAYALAEQQHTVHVLTLRGLGRGVWYSMTVWRPGEQITLEDHLQDLEMVMKAQGLVLEQLTIMGLGVGGILAQLYAEQHVIERLALLNACSIHRAVVPSGNRLPKDIDLLTIRVDYRRLVERGFRPLQTRHVMVMGARDLPVITQKALAATAQDYGVQAILLVAQTEPSYWDEVAAHLHRFAMEPGRQ
jgi:pimeloyl-ACP methyl ester carboxylesterase